MQNNEFEEVLPAGQGRVTCIFVQVLKAEGAADSTQVFSIFSGMNEVEAVVQPLDLTLGGSVRREYGASSFPVGYLGLPRRSRYLRAKQSLPVFESLGGCMPNKKANLAEERCVPSDCAGAGGF